MHHKDHLVIDPHGVFPCRNLFGTVVCHSAVISENVAHPIVQFS